VCASADPGGTLELAGHLDADIRYLLRLDYATTVNDRSCQFEDTITGLWIARLESRFERPEIEGDTHRLRISLSHPGGMGACEWRPSVIYLCVGPRDAADSAINCHPLFTLTTLADRPPPATLALICEPKFWNCVSQERRSPTREVSRFDAVIRLDISTGPLH
jgi:hypothetical protein